MTTTTDASRPAAGRRVFSRVLVGIDGSQQALEAARQAALLEDVDGELTLVSVWDIAHGVGGAGSRVPYYYDEELQRTSAEKALVAASDYVAPYAAAVAKPVRGSPVGELLKEIAGHTLVAVGSSGMGRLRGILEGEVATGILHRAPCSVLVARAAGAEFPRRIVVGVDGSAESAAAYGAARYLGERFGAGLRVLIARSDEPPVQALVAAAESADLVVVGSRGLHGLRALGSVSERVAHTAACSVLVVREPA